MRLCLRASDQILLIWIYGRHRVLAEHLTIIKDKPNILISNGDVLYGKGFIHYLIGVSMWMISTIIVLTQIFKLLPPRELDALKGGSNPSPLATVIAIPLFFVLVALPLGYSLTLAAIVLAICLLLPWVQDELERSS